MTTTDGAGWHRDPTGRYAQRYWDGTTWTDAVAGTGGGAPSRDPIPFGTQPAPPGVPVEDPPAAPSPAATPRSSRRMRPAAIAGVVCFALVLAVFAVVSGGGSDPGTGTGTGKAQPANSTTLLIQAAVGTTIAQSSRFKTTLVSVTGNDSQVRQITNGVQDASTHKLDIVSTEPFSKPDGSSGNVIVHVLAPDAGVNYEQIVGLEYPGGKSWTRFAPTDIQASDPAVGWLGSGNPVDALQFLQGVQSAELIPTPTIGGVRLTLYRVVVDFSRLFALLEQPTAKLSPDFVLTLSQLKGNIAVAQAPASVWIDDEGRIQRFYLTITAKVGAVGVTTVRRYEFSDFGTEVTVTPPPDDQVANFPDVANEFRAYVSGLGASTN